LPRIIGCLPHIFVGGDFCNGTHTIVIFPGPAFEIAHLTDDVLSGEAGDIGGFRMPLSRHKMAGAACHLSRSGSSFTILGAAPCSLGNQSGGFALFATSAASYTLVLPARWTGPVASARGACTLSGMLYAQEGRPLGTDCGTCAAVAKANSGARGKTLIQLLINLGRNRCTRIYTRMSRFGIGLFDLTLSLVARYDV